MNVCPNCNAALERKPCEACGWPASTQPPPGKGFTLHRGPSPKDEGAVSSTSRCCAFFALVASLTLFGFLYSVGENAKWTSDGPGMLVVWLGLFFSGIFVLVTAWALLWTILAPLLPNWLRFLLK